MKLKRFLIGVLVCVMCFQLVSVLETDFFNGRVSHAASTLVGDVSDDNKVNSTDYLLFKQYILGVISDFPAADDLWAGDVNGDGKINSSDMLLVKQYVLDLINSFPKTSQQQPEDGEKILIPHKSWTCGMADGIPKPEKGVLVLEADMKLAQVYNLGKTQYGQRQAYIIQSGTVKGSKISATVMSGGLDFQLDLSNGAVEIEQLLMLKASDGNYIYLRSAGTGANQNDVRIVPDFEAPSSSGHNWLNSGKFVGRRVVDLAAKTMKLTVYDVSGVSVKPDLSNSFSVVEPSDVEDQPWDFRKAASNEKRGNQFIVETVDLGGSQSVGATKRGSRNVIPITGGSVTGRINAKILAAGADYQNLGNPMTIDARYLWQTDDGEIIIVRNGGQFGSLVPTFEVRADSKYSYLNKNLYLSSDPGMGTGNVKITFYESKN